MALTKSQQNVLTTLQMDDVSLVLIPACAGSGKTHTLIELAKTLDINDGIYLAFNKSIADEATTKFLGTPIKCYTTHSLAYRAVVRQYGLKVGFFNIRDVITPGLNYTDKKLVVETLDAFLTSQEIDPMVFLAQQDQDLTDAVMQHLNLMSDGKLTCSHNFYLKLYHVLLASGALPPPKTDLLMLDEAGDINPVTLAIFKLIDAPKKIAVGDAKQNIYSFNGTIDGFAALAAHGVSVPLTQSFRVSAPIAKRIEHFIRANVDPTFIFEGREYSHNTPIVTRAYIARNNVGLVERMLELMKKQIPFHTTRKVEDIVELPLILLNINNGKAIKSTAFKHLETLRRKWEESSAIKFKYKSILQYMVSTLQDDEEFMRAAKIAVNPAFKNLNELVTYANKCKKADASLTLTTAHSAKGLEWSSVEIAEDLNFAVTKAQITKAKILDSYSYNKEGLLKPVNEEFLLYYVACSRAMIELTNATHLGREGIS